MGRDVVGQVVAVRGGAPEQRGKPAEAPFLGGARTPPEEFDPTLPGLFAGDPPAGFVRLLAAIETLFLIPVFLVTFFLQDHLLRGVTFGTVKR